MSCIKEINTLQFGVYSSEEIKAMSVCKVYKTMNSKKKGELSIEDDISIMNFDSIIDISIDDFIDKNTIGTEYDERMGPLRKGQICVSCKKDYHTCPGHFGHIELYTPILHPLYIKEIANFLACICHKCYRLLLTREQMYILGFNNYKDHFRYSKILEKTKKMGICFRCNTPCPKIVISKIDCNISFELKEKGQNKISTLVSTETIQKIFNNIPDEDITLMGFNPEYMHPRNLVITNFPVLPICSRSPVFIEGKMGDDDLTVQICEIIKLNNSIGKTLLEPGNEADKNLKKLGTYIQSLKFRIQTYMNNNHDKAKNPTNSRPIKAINQRIKGKSGLIRNNIMGKRTDQSARTVIGPDSSLRIDEVAVPIDICRNLTVPERVTSFNIKHLSRLIEEQQTHIIISRDERGNTKRFYSEYLLYNYNKYTKLKCWDVIQRGNDKIIVREPSNHSLQEGDILLRNGKSIEIVLKKRKPMTFTLKEGDIVERYLQKDDIVLLNRQPSLWKGSMIGLRVVPKSGKTIRFNLAICKSLNGDFDGDESNIYVPQSPEARMELMNISHVDNLIMSAQTSSNNMVLVQDPVLGAYLLTRKNPKITKGRFFDLSMYMENVDKTPYSTQYILQRIRQIRRITKQKCGKAQAFTGRGLLSMILPEGLNYTQKLITEDKLVIYDGVIVEGHFDKKVLGSSKNTIIQILYKEYSPKVAANFINNIQFVVNQWLYFTGFSIGLEDCIPQKVDEIQQVVISSLFKAESIKESSYKPGIKEMKIANILGNARDNGMVIAKKSLSKNNNFLSTILSGSKGDFFNIAQIVGLLGQQMLNGKRINPTMCHGKRVIPHYPISRELTMEEEYESRGFVSSSFSQGLSPREYFAHARSGREGVTHTAMSTSRSGYAQRKAGKLCEDLQVKYDGTVRNVYGTIFQNVYAGDGYDRAQMVSVDGRLECMDVSRIAEKINLQAEKINKKNKIK